MIRNKYKDYLQSEEWRVRKKIFIRAAGYKCHICGAANSRLHVHHLTYAHFGDEWDNDCVVLCEDCHNEVHEVVDYANLRKAKPDTDHRSILWCFLPHMRHANEKLILVCAATFAKRTISDNEEFEIFSALTYNDKGEYIRFENKSDAIRFVNGLREREAVKLAYANETVKDIQGSQEGNVYLCLCYDEIYLSDKFHWRYNAGLFKEEILKKEESLKRQIGECNFVPPPIKPSSQPKAFSLRPIKR